MNCDVPALWLEHKEALYYFILKRVPDESTAKDISQDVLLKVYNFCCCKSGVRNVRSWLFQIAHNTIADYYQKTSVVFQPIPFGMRLRKLKSMRLRMPRNLFCRW